MPDVTLESLGLAAPAKQPSQPAGPATLESLGLAAPSQPDKEPSGIEVLWSGIKDIAGGVADTLGIGAGPNLGGGGNLLGLEGKDALNKSAEFDVPYKPGMTAGQMIPPNWQENPMLSAFGPGNMLGRSVQRFMGPGVPIPQAAPPPPAAPQLLLPPPTVRVAGQPATPTGQLGVPSPWRSELEAGGRTLGEAPGLPPAFGGHPSAWREGLEARGRTLGEPPSMPPLAERFGLGGEPRVLPPGPQPGMLPPGPTSTMTHPAATPPPTSPRPAAPQGAPPEQPSALASAIASDNAGTVDQIVTRAYRGAIQPGTSGVKMSAPGIADEDRRIMTVVDKIIDNRDNIRLTAADGMPRPDGVLPRTRSQFLEAQDQTKRELFKNYDQMSSQAGGMGISVDPAPAIARLRAIEASPSLDAHPAVRAEAKRLADAMEQRGLYSPHDMQNLIQDITGDLRSFYKNPGAGSAAETRVKAPVVDILRKQLDDAIEASVGPGYQAFKTQYGALRSVERDLANAARKELSQRPGLASEFGDLLASESFIRGIATMSPATIAKAGIWKGARAMVNYFNDPNRAVARLFEHRVQSTAPPPAPSYRQNIYPPVTRELSRPEDEEGVGYRMPRASVSQF